MDFTARMEKAQEEAQPHRAHAEAAQVEARNLEAQWKELRKNSGTKPPAVQAAAEAWKTKEREARETVAKAVAIESAAFDLKAVNPHRVTEEDKRTPGELLAEIEAKGQDAEAALAQLWALLARGGPEVQPAITYAAGREGLLLPGEAQDEEPPEYRLAPAPVSERGKSKKRANG